MLSILERIFSVELSMGSLYLRCSFCKIQFPKRNNLEKMNDKIMKGIVEVFASSLVMCVIHCCSEGHHPPSESLYKQLKGHWNLMRDISHVQMASFLVHIYSLGPNLYGVVNSGRGTVERATSREVNSTYYRKQIPWCTFFHKILQ